MKGKRLGRGLDALIPQVSPEEQQSQGDSLNQIKISQIIFNHLQPRQEIHEKRFEGLKKSIAEHGIIQPITVRAIDGQYELVSGERRLRAVISLEYEEVPAFVISVDSEDKLLELALIENIQREDLNPVEIAIAYQKLQKEYGLTQEEVARKVGKERATVANFIRLLKLPESILDAMRNEQISMGHARALMGLDSSREQILLCKNIIQEDLSVRKVEESVRSTQKKIGKPAQKAIPPQKNPQIQVLEDRFRTIFSTHVMIRPLNNGGKIEITYFSNDDLDRILDIVEQ